MKDALQISYDVITANSAQMAVYGIDYAYGLKPDAVRDGDTLQEHDGGRQQALIAGQTDADKTVRYDNYRLMRNYLSDREFYIGTIIWNKIYAAALWENRREKEGIMNEDADIMYRIIGDDGEVMRECYNRLLEYYKNNNSEMRKYRFRDYKKYLRIIACYVMRKHEWFTKYL